MNELETAMVAWLVVHCLLTVVIWWRTDSDLGEAFLTPELAAAMFILLFPTYLKHIALSHIRKAARMFKGETE